MPCRREDCWCFIMSKGIAQVVAPLAIGAVLGLMLFMYISSKSTLRSSEQLTGSTAEMLPVLYQGENMMTYFEEEEALREILRGYVETGGPKTCGTAPFGREVAVWKKEGCEVTEEPGLEGDAGRIAAGEFKKYAGYWDVSISRNGTVVCMVKTVKLPWGVHRGRFCYESPLLDDVRRLYGRMKAAYDEGRGECTCSGDYRICWTDIDGYNFTYAVQPCS